ncbi:L-serine ammonia-lyase [Aneurinibacillus soli]|uniref:L-serine deaminase n=1 Tax=Aneurinibacillus soli TaxID=1500254 RepID=A0A0U5B2A2_9BACL|nr:L-serine ammonia-lyase, iron-sulfur-dependent subunit beta [Aneurinibacillus soli]PYE61710.1 L-serine ammonia-lyase [Aneurinibacillus soli]BAU28432.1 L-serine dehydratase, beta chain [Aneurinibacillus soli]
MKYTSVFEIIGPIMVGPSSSHTAGAVRIGNIARQILDEHPTKVTFQLMGSFAETYQGHGTDLALLAGILGMTTASNDVPISDQIASKMGVEYSFTKANAGMHHPNTVRIEATGPTRSVKLLASSLGGGKAEVQELDDLPVKFTGEKPTLILYHTDQKGFLAKISHILNIQGYNIARLTLERWKKGELAITVCEVDEILHDEIIQMIKASIPFLKDIKLVQTI